MAIPDTIEAELLFYFDGIYMCNTFYFTAIVPPIVAGNDLVVAGALGTWCINRYLPCIGSNVLLVRSRARDMSSGVGAWVNVPYFGYVGTYPDVAMSANVTIRVGSKSRVDGSRQHAYVCVPGVPRATVVENEITSAYRGMLIDAFSYIYEPPFTSNFERVFVSYRKNNAWRSVAYVGLWGALKVTTQVAPRRHRLKNTVFIP